MEHGIPHAFGSYQELLDSREVDAIYNPLPNSMHAEWTIKALEAGIPVLCEKPFTVNADEAREVVAVARNKGVLLAEAFMYRFHPIYDIVLETIRAGEIGDVLMIRSSFAFRIKDDPKNIRLSGPLAGGALMDVGCYCVNLSRRIAGCEPVRASALEHRADVDVTLLGNLEFPNGVLAQFECSFERFGRRRAEIEGTEGVIILESPWFPGEDRAQFILRRGDKEQTVTTMGANSYHLEVSDFAQACKTHRPLRWPAEDAVANMAVIDALYRSAREGVTAEVERVM
jgi:predicted dehydrogenase